MKTFSLFLTLLLLVSACEQEGVVLKFSEVNFTSEDLAIIEVNIPKAEGKDDAIQNINTSIETFVAQAIDFNEKGPRITIQEAAADFDNEYKLFSENISEAVQPWEALVDAEVNYNSSNIISIAFNTYLNTGGAHGNSIISFLNFNPSNGALYTRDDVIDHLEDLTVLVEQHFNKALAEESDATDTTTDVPFKLPETIGFSDDGIIIVYNPHELEDYPIKMLEFTIPYSEARALLNIY